MLRRCPPHFDVMMGLFRLPGVVPHKAQANVSLPTANREVAVTPEDGSVYVPSIPAGPPPIGNGSRHRGRVAVGSVRHRAAADPQPRGCRGPGGRHGGPGMEPPAGTGGPHPAARLAVSDPDQHVSERAKDRRAARRARVAGRRDRRGFLAVRAAPCADAAVVGHAGARVPGQAAPRGSYARAGRPAGAVPARGRARRHARLHVSGDRRNAAGAHRHGALASRPGTCAAAEGVVDARTGRRPRRAAERKATTDHE